MKIIAIIPIFLLFLQIGFSQKYDSRIAESQTPLDQVELILMPALDNSALLETELERRGPGVAPRFAETMEVDIAPDTHGFWEELPNGQAVWRLRLLSEDAFSLNLGFSHFFIPEGGTLILYSPDKKHVLGPFTPADNEAHEQLWTPIFDGDALVIEVQLPQEKRQELALRLSSVNHDFIGFSNMAAVVSGACNLDVICGEADGWEIVDSYRDIIQSVAVISVDGGTICTGFLVNNARQDCTPYFMTAAHCGLNQGTASSLVAYWNFEHSTCRQPNSGASGGAGNGTLTDFNSGSIFRAGTNPDQNSDFTLVELDDPVSPTANAFFAGWNAREETTSDTTICVHHPRTDEKRISFEFGNTYVGAWNSGDDMVPGGDHLIVPDWDIGTTEGGSSGGPLFNKDKQVVGQLHGGLASCNNDEFDSFGWFFSSWEGNGTPSTRLKDWLDPDDTGILEIDGRWGMSCDFFINPTISTQQVCTPDEAVYTLEVSENFAAPVNLSLSGVPAGATATFSTNPANAGEIVTLTISNTVVATPGNYSILVEGTDGAESVETELSLSIFDGTPGNIPLNSPANGAVGVSIFPTYSWTDLDQVENYDIQIATDPAFSNIVSTSEQLEGAFVMGELLEVLSTYYWRIRGNNTCGTGDWSTPFSFTTAAITCAPTTSANVPVIISVDGTPTITSTIEITDPGNVLDLRVVDLGIEHSWVGDLFVTLTSPSGTEIVLFDRPGVPAETFGCGSDNLELGFDDLAANTAADLEASCNDPGPAITGVYQPVDLLATFAGEPVLGTWTLTITDNANQDGGVLNSWALDICATIPAEASIVQLEHEAVVCNEAGISGEIVLGTGFDGAVDLSIEGLPNDVTVEWSENPSNPGATVSFNIIGNLPTGILNLEAIAADNSAIASFPFSVTVDGAPAPFLLVSPANNTPDLPEVLLLSWDASSGANDYQLVVATDSELTEIFFSGMVSGTSYNLTDLPLSTTYYWQVEAVNECGSVISEIFSFSTMIDLTIDVSPQVLSICQSDAGVFELSIGNDFGEDRTYSFSESPAAPLEVSFMEDTNDASLVRATLENLSATPLGTYSLIFMVEDSDGNNATVEAILMVEGPPLFTTLLSPSNGLTILEQSPELDWTTVSDVSSYTIEISDTDLFTNIIESANVTVSSYEVNTLLQAGTYYWRVTTNNECGSSVSGSFSFDVMLSGLTELNGRRVDIHPNPTNDLVNVLFSEPLSGDLTVEVFSVNGQQLQGLHFHQPLNKVEINLGAYAGGVYLLRLINEEASLSKRIILQK